MVFLDLPASAAWRHRDAREGFEVVFLRTLEAGLQIDGHTSAVEDGHAWAVHYTLSVGPDWITRSAHVVGHSATGGRQLSLTRDADGGWLRDGAPAPDLDGCADVDLECSAFTNALPVHRLRLQPGQASDAPAAYVRARDLGVERLGQRYRRLRDEGTGQRYAYAAPRFEFEADLAYDESGLVLDYPGLAIRVI